MSFAKRLLTALQADSLSFPLVAVAGWLVCILLLLLIYMLLIFSETARHSFNHHGHQQPHKQNVRQQKKKAEG